MVHGYLLDVFNGVCWLNIKSNCLACQGFHENLHIFYLSKNDNMNTKNYNYTLNK